MSREPALEVGECPLTRHRPKVRRVTHTHIAAGLLGWTARLKGLVCNCKAAGAHTSASLLVRLL
eukprot:1490032-Prymnesium_polylepis.1